MPGPRFEVERHMMLNNIVVPICLLSGLSGLILDFVNLQISRAKQQNSVTVANKKRQGLVFTITIYIFLY